MDNDIRGILEEEKALGRKAQQAYDSFIGPFIEGRKQLLFDAFEAVPANDTEQLQNIKLMSLALSSLDSEIIELINSGKMASESLKKNEELH